MNIAVKPENLNSCEALAGKVSLVTGSASGIGLRIAGALAAAGSDIVLNGLGKPEEVAAVRANIAADFNVE
jgi:3-hydroxybutyrate dehydrogenase